VGNFQNNAITDAGRMLLADVQAGAVFTPTRIVIGSGSMPSGATTQGMTNVITPVKSLTINKKKRTPDGKCVFGGVYTNEEVTDPFYFRELALYAKAVYLNPDGSVKSEGAEVLYSYGNAGATADYMPAYSTSTVVEKQMDLVTWVGNNAQVDLTIETGIFVTQDQAVLNMEYIRPDTVGFDSLLEYMASIYPQNIIVCGHISGFSDMPEGVTILHGTINVVGGQLTVSGNARTAFYYRGTNSLTEWTSGWRKAYDATEDLTIDKAIAAVKLVTPSGSGEVFKNANATNDLGTTISDGTKDGVTDRINLSAARTLAEKMRLVVAGEKIYNILHTGNKELIKPVDIGAAPATLVHKVYDTDTNEAVDAVLEAELKDMPGHSIRHICLSDNVGNTIFYGGMTHITINKVTDEYASVEAVRYHTSGVLMWKRCKYVTWLGWEWENPVLDPGFEYRTTERYKGYVVIKKVNSKGDVLWRAENETSWRLLTSASAVAPATVE
jgi:hypothetical protein